MAQPSRMSGSWSGSVAKEMASSCWPPAVLAMAARIVLVEAGPRALATFPEKLSAYTEKELKRLRVELRTNTRVVGIDAEGVTLQGADEDTTVLPSATMISGPRLG